MQSTWEWVQYLFSFDYFNNKSENKQNFDKHTEDKSQHIDFEKIMSNSEIIYW